MSPETLKPCKLCGSRPRVTPKKDIWMLIKSAPKACDPSILLSNAQRQEVWMDFWDEDAECWSNAAEYEMPQPTHWMPLPPAPTDKESK